MSRRTGRNSSYTSGVNPSGFFRAEVVSVSGDYLSVKIPRLGLENIYEDVPFVGFTPAAGDKIWASFVEGNSSHLLCFIGAGDTSSDIAAIVAGVNLNGGGTGGSIQLSLDDSITLTSVTADNFYGALTGNADTATALATARTIGGVSFDGTSNINLPGVNTGGSQDTTGNAATATALATARAINGVNFDGSAAITVTAAAGTLTGATLNSGVTASSLTSVGTLTSLNVTGGVTGNVTGDVTGNADTATTATNLSGGSVAATTLTASGDANFDSGTLFVDVSTNRVGINTSSPTQTLDVNGILNVSGDIRYNGNAIVASYTSSTNIDHIWHDETNNAWNFVSDSTYKAAGNSALNAATLNVTTVNLNTSVHLTNVDADGSMRVQGNTGYIEIGPKNATYCHIDTDRGSFYMNQPLNMNGGSTVRGALTVDGTLYVGSTLTAIGTLNAGSAAISGNLTVNGTTDLGQGTLTNVLRLHVNEIYADVGGSGDPSYTFGSPNDNTGMYLKTTGQLGFSLSGSEQMYLASNGLYMASGDWFRSSGSSGWYNDTYAVGLYATQPTWLAAYGSGNVGLIVESTVALISPLNTTTTSGSLYTRRESTFGTLQTYSSTRELKENVQSINPAESGRIIDMLRPVTYIEKYRSGPDGSFVEGIPDNSAETADQYKLREWDIEYGFIAEELDALEPEGIKLASYDWQQIDEEGFPKPNGWKDSNITAILVAEVKELRKRLAVLEQLQ